MWDVHSKARSIGIGKEEYQIKTGLSGIKSHIKNGADMYSSATILLAKVVAYAAVRCKLTMLCLLLSIPA